MTYTLDPQPLTHARPNNSETYEVTLEYMAKVGLNQLLPGDRAQVEQALHGLRTQGIVKKDNIYVQVIGTTFCLVLSEDDENKIIVRDLLNTECLRMLGHDLEGICKRKIKARDVGASRQSSRDRQSFRSSEAVAHSLYSSVLPTPQPPSQELGEGGGLCRFRPWTFLPLLSLPFLYRHPLEGDRFQSGSW